VTRAFRRATRAALHVLAALIALPLFAQTNEAPKLPGKVSIAQKLGTELPKNLVFRNDRDEIVRLGDLMKSGRPVLLNFVYFNCPMLCPMTLEGLTNTLSELKFDAGKEFDIITVSIDPRDKVSAAAAMKDKYVKRYGRLQAAKNWHFLMANETTIKRLADSVGFQFAYDPHTDQFAHGAALLILTPDGRTSRYFYGFEYKARDLRLAIVEASGGKIGTATDQFLLLCFHYDPATGKYSRAAMNFARVGGGVTVAFLGSFIFLMLRKERAKPQQDGHESL
jgi:protein SCO1